MVQVPVNLRDIIGVSLFNEVLLLRGQFEPVSTQASRPGTQVSFHGVPSRPWSTQWRCGLASVIPSPGEKVWGAVFEITDEDLKILDDFEGDVPQGAYRHLPVTVITEEGEKLLVTTHAANPIGKFKPKEHYIDWVLKGIKQWKLPEECTEQWKAYKPA